ncbi:hypothetical protein J27TS7_38850 [Paenibacillus dendritiformis]|uniref:hypothetical protein n=1 Tax=Paenibacillus dendritiformis TaxID=130049 RepID=UPI001B1732C2|nr:hypothetical protein [Paenibacillus dendritiformis]GIO74371.1 hypothetical protein J27TS7_38850 [Paenibacillus dendritiformis]
MEIEKRNNILEAIKCLTGSIMSYEDIMNEYNALTPPKRTYIYSKVHQIVKHMYAPFDKAQPLIVVSINVLAAEENIDPAVALLIYTDKNNKKTR